VSLSLLGWRRAVSSLYAAVRADPDPTHAHARWRAGRDDLFASHPDSPLTPQARRSFAGLPVAPYDPAYRFVVPVDAGGGPARFVTETGTNGTVGFGRIGSVLLAGIGSLDLWWLESYGGGLFLPVRDGSAGTQTYGGGRYVLDTAKGADLGGDERALVVDLNFAYHPSCAYDPAWACPLAPEGNIVAAPVPVGELLA
jgi:uncharacterized protein (DUF1684 family)